VAVSPADLAALAALAVADPVVPTVARRLELYLATRRPALLRKIDTLFSSDNVPASIPTAAQLAKRGETLATLLTLPVPPLTLPELVAAGIVTRVADLAVLDVTSLESLAALHLTPYAINHALPRAGRNASELRLLLKMTFGTWLAHAATLAPRDLKALDIQLDAWFTAQPVLIPKARATAPVWLAQGTPEQWVTYAGLSVATQRALVPAPATAAAAATPTAVSVSSHSHWI
jgi:hypothetical protein